MKNIIKLLFTGLLFLALPLTVKALVPEPTSITLSGGQLSYTSGCRIFYETRSTSREIENTLLPMAKVLAGELEIITGIKPAVVKKTKKKNPSVGDISLEFDEVSGVFAINEADEDQSYSLKVDKNIIIRSQYYKGLAFGSATLLQSLIEKKDKFFIPKITVKDTPSSDFRSVMLDVARSYHSVGVLKEVVRLAHLYKLRYLHLHLTDHNAFTFPFEPVVSKLKHNYQYSRQEMLELVAYADAHGITIIPEIDLPGHSAKIIESGYLESAAGDYDVADPAYYAKIGVMIDDVLSVFKSSPYFHVGGDESGAGNRLVPFLSYVNKHLRGLPNKKRMIVWEGFHGNPVAELPATGEDRVIVMHWDNRFNKIWDLLKNGYEVINCSWDPTYIVGGGSGPLHVGNPLNYRSSLAYTYNWNKNQFPVTDIGPSDPNPKDALWDATYINKESQVIGAQLNFWEQKEECVIESLQFRIPAFANKLWNAASIQDFDKFKVSLEAINKKIFPIVQPVEIIIPNKLNAEDNPIVEVYHPYEGEFLDLILVNRTKLKGNIHYEIAGGGENFEYLMFGKPVSVEITSPKFDRKVHYKGGFQMAASLFVDGKKVPGTSWARFNNIRMRARYTDYDFGSKFGVGRVDKAVDLSTLPASKIVRSFDMPLVRGPLQYNYAKGQRIEGLFIPEKTGEYIFKYWTGIAYGNIYVDLNLNNKWEDSDAVMLNAPPAPNGVTSKPVVLQAGEKYPLRIDSSVFGRFAGGFGVQVKGPDQDNFKGVSHFMYLPDNDTKISSWSNRKGKVIKAALVRVEGNKAVFKMSNGKIYKCPIEDLSDESQSQVKAFQKK